MIADGKWHLIAVTVERSRHDGIRWYLDGQPAGAPADPTGRSGSLSNPSPLRFATRTVSPDGWWKGDLDEPALYSRALTAPEIKRMQEAGAAGMCKCISNLRGLEAWWQFDETAGTFIPFPSNTSFDASMHGHTATRINGPITVPGMVGTALSFDGVNDYAEVPDDPGLNVGTNDFSIVTWIRTSMTTGTQSIVDKRRSAAGFVGYHLYLTGGHPGLALADGSFANYTAAPMIADGKWHLLAVTVERSRRDGIHWYLDGQLAGPPADPTAHTGSLSNPSALRF